MSKRKHKHKKKEVNIENGKNCYNCDNCLYVGEGGYICSQHNAIVLEEWQPTNQFCICEGKDFIDI